MTGKNIVKRFGYIFEYIVLVSAVIIFWLIMDKTDNLNPVVMPSLKKIFSTCKGLLKNGSLVKHTGISLARVLEGYAVSAVLGILLGIFIGLSKHLDRITKLVIQIIKPIPPIAWIPLVILWFGIGESGKVFLIFLGGFFTILINVIDGIKQTDPNLLEVSKIYETPLWKHIIKLVIPSAAPNIFTGLRTGLTSCWMCVVAAELVSSTTGLGYMIMDARQYGQTDVVIVGMITIGLVGKVMDSLLHFIEKKVVVWSN
ncbi:MAG: ABC transporter permease [Treponema sp.]|nr:ABC transporter permease [Treponema sp.]